MASIAFIGLGNMGGPMAANLVKAGHAVHGFDLAADLAAAAARAGVQPAASAGAAAAQADVVITMLPATRPVLDVWSEALPEARPGTLFIDCSTIDVAGARQAHGMALDAGKPSLDAPVSGGTGGAKAATLTFMCGGEAAAFERAQPILAGMGRKVVPCGGPGSGQAAKICNNMMLGIHMIATAEAFVLAERLGLTHQALFDVASASSGQSWSLTTYCPVPGPVPTSPANAGYAPGFSAALMLKDLRLAQQAAAACGAQTPLGQAAERLYADYAASGEGGSDFSGIIRLIREADRADR